MFYLHGISIALLNLYFIVDNINTRTQIFIFMILIYLGIFITLVGH